MRATAVWAMILLLLPSSLLAGEGAKRSGGVAKHALPSVLPSLDLASLDLKRLAAADDGTGKRQRLISSAKASSGKEETQSESRWDRRLFLSAALAVSAGALARWTKQEADSSYDNYLESASPQRQKSAFKRAKEYDRLSGAALIGMEAGIILSTYVIFF